MAVHVTTEQLREALEAAHLDKEETAWKAVKRLREARAAAAQLPTLEAQFSKLWTRAIGLLRAVLQTGREAEAERAGLLARLRKALGDVADDRPFIARYAKVRSHDERLLVSADLKETREKIDTLFGGYGEEPSVSDIIFTDAEHAKLHAIARVRAELRGERRPPFVSARVRAARERAQLRRFEAYALVGEAREKAWKRLTTALQIEAGISENDGSALDALEAELRVLRRVVPDAEAIRQDEEAGR